ncbi:tetraacyldisaccharide 4'-kinase [Rheinheimera nanhaiensis]|uniref:Tetraacyldisaccharide 4'-kinase n=1 Tax=Rheinheimera nanhaiensis E407-8 TaxID=562729 RepID=I1E102_9GAMM|nr:tetraacyldisaccharide 4'-kinase [Rheinheimera nanhaiensis]GAB59980.1 tetraacyldisaccharide 4'-kinase [Rheinheimera nanhaiensis E407-8]
MSQRSDFIERIWYQGYKGYGAYYLLLPLSVLFALISALRRLMFRFGVLTAKKLPVPVIVVGNISVGGTGKTPFTLALCKLLQQQGYTPGIISRGYGADIKAPLLVTAGASAAEVGDEPLMLYQQTGCPVVVCPDRVAAGYFLLAQTPCDIIISDDGLQHYRLARDLEIILLDGCRGLGNGQLLPAGPLREGPWRLKTADLVVANSQMLPQAHGLMQLVPGKAKALCGDTELSSCAVSLVAAIGNPARFARTAQQAGFTIGSEHYFADHHQFVAADFANITGPVLMTEKDAVKCRPFAGTDWFSLGVQARLEQPLEAKLTTLITRLRSSYGA